MRKVPEEGQGDSWQNNRDCLAIFFWIMLNVYIYLPTHLPNHNLAIFFWIMLYPWELIVAAINRSGSCYFLLNYAKTRNSVRRHHHQPCETLLFSFELCPRATFSATCPYDNLTLLFSFELCGLVKSQSWLSNGLPVLLFSFELCSLMSSFLRWFTVRLKLAIFFWIMPVDIDKPYKAVKRLAIFFWIMLALSFSLSSLYSSSDLLFSFELCPHTITTTPFFHFSTLLFSFELCIMLWVLEWGSSTSPTAFLLFSFELCFSSAESIW